MNRVVVITGASSGLGLSLAEKFLRAGDQVYGISKTRRNWKTAKAKLAGAKNFHLDQGDVSLEANVKAFLLKVYKQAGRIDILINNAGYAHRLARIEEETLSEFKKHLSANLISVFLVCKHSLPIFQKQNHGWILNIASMAGVRAVPRLGAYSAGKFGVLALTQSIAKENKEARFSCVTVCPGGINTQMREKLFGKEDANRQQSAEFVADKILEIVEGKIPMHSGSSIVIRHGQIDAIHFLPEA